MLSIPASENDFILDWINEALGVDRREVLLLHGDRILQELCLLDFLEHL